MATVLTAARRWINREFTSKKATATLTRTDIEAAVTVADQWITDNTASFKAVLPEPFKSIATNDQKLKLLLEVLNG